MELEIYKVASVIDSIEGDFTSHKFIEKYAKEYEKEYIEMLYEKRENQAFQTVHAQLAHFLSKNKSELNIKNEGKTPSENIFGNINNVEKWCKVK